MDEQKTCGKCGGAGPFSKNKSKSDGLQSWCKECLNTAAALDYQTNPEKFSKRSSTYRQNNPERYKNYDRTSRLRDPQTYMWKKAKDRAQRKNIPFDIEPSDISIPSICPLLGIELQYGRGVQGRSSPTLDRKNPVLGYVKGNVWVISYKANAMKQDATPVELAYFARKVLLLLPE